mmetsp:Transcript_71783/g.131437  ORF Transcript_71783/g.131437 Transcript_71783/m.131437 type:complete len:381 (+) Transcript_71783:1892-3034(+)
MTRVCTLALYMVDLGQNTLAQEARVKQIVIHHNVVYSACQIVDVFSIRVDDGKVRRRPVDELQLLLWETVLPQDGQIYQRQMLSTTSVICNNRCRFREMFPSSQYVHATAHTNEKPSGISNSVSDRGYQVLHCVVVCFKWISACVEQLKHLIHMLDLSLPLQKQRNCLCLLRIAVINSTWRWLGIYSPLSSRRVPDRMVCLRPASVMPIYQVCVKLWLEWRRRFLLVTKHCLQLLLLHLRLRVVPIPKHNCIRIVLHRLLILFILLLLCKFIELCVVSRVLLDQLVLIHLISDSPRFLCPCLEVLVVGLLLESFLKHFERLIVELHLKCCPASTVVTFGPGSVQLYGIGSLHQCIGVLSELKKACGAIAIDLPLLGNVSD